MITNDNRITLVLIDTCAFRDANSDFLGISKTLLPAFFETIEEKGLVLLTHPILEYEIKKHIEDSGLFKDYTTLINQLHKCDEILKYFKFGEDISLSRISGINILEKLFDAYKEHYRNAISLDYANPSGVFELYFNGKPPFAVTGKKKNEFPDAFVIEATKEYMDSHPNEVLLVVSKDNDWKSAFDSMQNVTICENISKAQTIISHIDSILNQEMVRQIFCGAYQEIVAEAQACVECECFELENYETLIELEIQSVTVESINEDVTPLKITRDSLLLNTSIRVNVSGYAEAIDEEQSIWNREEQEYIYMEYVDIDFNDASAEVECEVLISFDFDNLEDTAQVVNFKLLNSGSIYIDCQDAIISHIDEDEMALRVLREDKGYPRR